MARAEREALIGHVMTPDPATISELDPSRQHHVPPLLRLTLQVE